MAHYTPNITPQETPSPSPTIIESLEIDTSHCMQTGRFTAESSLPATRPKNLLPPITPKNSTLDDCYILPAYSDFRLPASGFRVEPWNHPSFAPLPGFINRRLQAVDSTDSPDRSTFDRALASFLGGLMEPYRETACLTPDIYAAVSRSLSKREPPKLTATIRDWIFLHHLCSGSDGLHLILAPREAIYQLENNAQEAHRLEYCARVSDQQESELERPGSPDGLPQSTNLKVRDYPEAFDRLPVRSQVYDILTYVHVSHNNPFTMVRDIKQLGFVSLLSPPQLPA
jgi:hypothetical protein